MTAPYHETQHMAVHDITGTASGIATISINTIYPLPHLIHREFELQQGIQLFISPQSPPALKVEAEPQIFSLNIQSIHRGIRRAHKDRGALE